MKTRAAVIHEMEKPRPYAVSKPMVIETLDLDPPGEDEILVRIRAAGLCHSDLSTINGDRPIVKQIFWSIRTTACPEPYIQLRAEPGREEKWTITYDFFTKYIPQ